MNLTRSLPSLEPLTLTEAKTWLRIDHDDEDALVESLIQTARDQVEEYTSRTLVTRNITLKIDRREMQRDGWIWLPYGPVSSVTSVKWISEAGVETTIPSSDYYLTGDRIVSLSYWEWEREWGSIVIAYAAGYGAAAASVPSGLLQAVRVLLADLYEMRQSHVAGESVSRVTTASWRTFTDPYRQGNLSTWA